jgi:hypothetical protein
MWNDKSLSKLLSYQTFARSLTDNSFVILKTPYCDSWDIQGQSLSHGFKALSCTTLSPGLGACICLATFFVACICAWRHFLGVQLYSNSNIGRQNFERVLCLILPSHLVESVSFAILHCQSYLQECISRGGLLHYSREQYLSWGSTAALNCFLLKECFQNDKR